MENFDLEALTKALDNAGFNKMVLVNLHALEITGEEFADMIIHASGVYHRENPDDRISISVLPAGEGSFYVAVINENEMLTL